MATSVAGFNQANIPPVIKQVTPNIIAAGLNTQNMMGGVKAGDTVLQRFQATVLDADSK